MFVYVSNVRTLQRRNLVGHGKADNELASVVSDKVSGNFQFKYGRVVERCKRALFIVNDVLDAERNIKTGSLDAKNSPTRRSEFA